LPSLTRAGTLEGPETASIRHLSADNLPMYMDMAEVLLYAAEVSTILIFPATLLGIWLAVRPPDRNLPAADTGRVTLGLGARPAVAVAGGTANGYACCTSAEALARSHPPRSSPRGAPTSKR
jgi:hypothetical protein